MRYLLRLDSAHTCGLHAFMAWILVALAVVAAIPLFGVAILLLADIGNEPGAHRFQSVTKERVHVDCSLKRQESSTAGPRLD